MDRGGCEREAAATGGRHRRFGLGRGIGVGGGSAVKEWRWGVWVENVHEDRPRVSARVGLGRWIRKHLTVVDA